MSKTGKLRLGIFFALVLTVVLIFAHGLLPQKQLQLLPAAEPIMFVYGDDVEGGGTQALWVDYDSQHWRCQRDPDLPSLYCGFNLSLSQNEPYTEGMDLSGYTHLHIKLTLNSPKKRIELALRNYIEGYSVPSDGDSAQYLRFGVRAEDIQQVLDIELDEFRVADWWVDDRNVPRRYLKPRFDNITIIGINFGENLPPGANDIIVESITLSGEWVSAETWYLLMLSCWLGVGGLVFLGYSLSLSQRARGRVEMYTRLASRHRALRSEARELKEAAERDSLTGLLNRRGLEKFYQGINTGKVERALAVVVMDIDHFKRINDRRGHAEGDEVIRQVAEIVRQNTRDRDLVARWGGEEFVMVCPGTSADQAGLLAEKIREKIFGAVFNKKKPLAVSASFGVAEFGDSETFENVLARADRALYEAKAQGRNCTVVAAEVVTDHSSHRASDNTPTEI